ncbi:HEAT repeat domain-containing protein [Candidatus Uabimicrobium sp. HlEnr_7]|uniref:HEAT repeat domain-containing protein n=1 Tax=Candidatus Uabimicrobium helgolandensis TaxID=3095367 RepID=UPI0035586412
MKNISKEIVNVLQKLLLTGLVTLLCGQVPLSSQTNPELDKLVREFEVIDLIEKLQDENWRTRRDAAKALASMGKDARPAVSILIKTLRDKNKEVRKNALLALLFIKPREESLPTLMEVFTDPDITIKTSVVHVLGSIIPKLQATISALTGVLSDKNKYVRRAAVETVLENVKTRSIIPALVQAVSDRDSYVSITAIKCLVRIDPKEKVLASVLIKTLGDKDRKKRIFAIETLAKIESETVLLALIQTLEDGDEAIVYTAVKALGEIGEKAKIAIPHLVKTFENQSSFVKEQVVRSLGKISAEVALPTLVQALNDEDCDVKRSAVEVLRQISRNNRGDLGIQAQKTLDKLNINK